MTNASNKPSGYLCKREKAIPLAKALPKMITILEHEYDDHTPVYKDAPLAPVRLKDEQRYWDWVVIRCPYCEGSHVHGGIGKHEDPLESLGGRMAHCHADHHVDYDVRDSSPCWNGDAEYRLIPIDGVPTVEELDAKFPTVLDTVLDGYHVSNWTRGLDNSPYYSDYIKVQRRKQPGHVYLIEAGGRYKIGVAGDIGKRMDAISTSSPFPIELVHSVHLPSPYELEKTLHRFCASERVHREWFALDENLIEQVIAKMNREVDR